MTVVPSGGGSATGQEPLPAISVFHIQSMRDEQYEKRVESS